MNSKMPATQVKLNIVLMNSWSLMVLKWEYLIAILQSLMQMKSKKKLIIPAYISCAIGVNMYSPFTGVNVSS